MYQTRRGGFGSMVTAINEIKSILQAIGANPEIINGNTVKINAPDTIDDRAGRSTGMALVCKKNNINVEGDAIKKCLY